MTAKTRGKIRFSLMSQINLSSVKATTTTYTSCIVCWIKEKQHRTVMLRRANSLTECLCEKGREGEREEAGREKL